MPIAKLDGRLERVDFVSLFPSQFCDLTTKVTVVGRFGVDRTQQIKLADDVSRLERKDFIDSLFNFRFVDGVGTECVDGQRNRFREPNRVSRLQFTLGCQTSCNDVLGDPATHVRSTAVDFGWILSGESTTAVSAHAP